MAEAGTFTVKIDMPETCLVDYLRDLADYHHNLGNKLEELANRQDRIEHNPGFAARIVEAEDQVLGDELLDDAQNKTRLAEDGQAVAPGDKPRAVIHKAIQEINHFGGCKDCGAEDPEARKADESTPPSHGSGKNPPPDHPPPSTDLRI